MSDLFQLVVHVQSATPLNRRAAEQSKETVEEHRAASEAAFNEWLKRKKNGDRHRFRSSPTREQIEKHQREDARQRVINEWLARGERAMDAKTTNGLQSSNDAQRMEQ